MDFQSSDSDSEQVEEELSEQANQEAGHAKKKPSDLPNSGDKILLLSQALIQVSTNSITRNNQKIEHFGVEFSSNRMNLQPHQSKFTSQILTTLVSQKITS